MRRRVRILAGIVCALVVTSQIPAFAASGSGALKPDPNGMLRVGQGGGVAVPTWDANKYPAGNSYIIAFMEVYDRLLQLSADSKELRPYLATSWKWDSTNTKLTLPLRKDVKFQDGAAFNAAVAVANIKRSVEKDGGVSATQLATMTAVEALDEYTVQLTFSQPNPAVVYSFASYGGMMVSPNGLANPAGLKTAPAGSGPMRFVEQGADLTAKFDRWDGYWDKTHVYPAHFQILNMTDEVTRANAVKTGQLEVTNLLTYDPSQKDASLQVASVLAFGPFSLMMNNKVAPFSDVRVRKAVDIALNRDAVNASQNGQCIPWSQALPVGVDGYLKGLKPTKSDVTAAKKLIADAGATGVKVNFVHNNIEPYITFAKIAQAQLQAIGLDVQLTSVSAALGRSNWRSGQFGIGVFTVSPVTSSDPTSYLDQYALGIDNPGTKDPNLQAMVDKARVYPLGSKERTAGFQDINKYLIDNPIWVGFCNGYNTTIGSKNVIGLDNMPGSRLIVTPDLHLVQVAKTAK